MKTAAAAQLLRPALLAYFDFSGGAVRVWTGYGSLTWSGDTYTGLGDFCGVDRVMESREVRANGVAFTLNGVPSAMVTRVLAENYRGRACQMWLGLFDDTMALIADPVLLFGGRMDQCVIRDDGTTSTVTVTAESRLADLNRARERRYTDQDQQQLYPGDLGLGYVAGLQQAQILWGAAGNTAPGGATAVVQSVAAGAVRL